jgi:4-alpha-glucanotransferase
MTSSLSSARSAGIILHPTSLPGPFGIGDLGPAAYAWVDLLAGAGQKWWQVLPLGPTGFGDSPYQCFSAFAGNPLLVSPQLLIEDGLLSQGDLASPGFPAERVDYGPAINFKNHLLEKSWANYRAGRGASLKQPYEEFLHEHMSWIEDYALFMAIKDAHGGHSWFDWPAEIRLREPGALARSKQELVQVIGLHQFRQFLFFRQWLKLRGHASRRKLRIIGDIPIFVSGDSADVWANPQLFQLDAQRRPRVVAGVPPDYFSATGQLWGNPLYDWAALKRTDFAWWLDRLRAALLVVDVVRLDHFRGFEACWEIPAGRPNAVVGQWVKAPGQDLFQRIQTQLGGLPLIAEDLGLITPEVEAIRDRFELPGMRVLQFAFGDGPANPYLPHNFIRRTLAYTGTHDNDTSRGWYASAQEKERDHIRRYTCQDGSDIAWDLIRLAWASVADLAIAPLQDVLDLGTEARMNMPGRPAGNWSWRYQSHELTAAHLGRLGELTALYGR